MNNHIRYIMLALVIGGMPAAARAFSCSQPTPAMSLSGIHVDINVTNASLQDVLQIVLDADRPAHREMPLEGFWVHAACSNITLTIQRDNFPAADLVAHLARVYELFAWMERGTLYMAPFAQTPMRHRMYDVLPHLFPDADVGGQDVTSYFHQFGITFPPGATATFLPQTGKLITLNTLANLQTIERVLSVLNVVPYQVLIHVRLHLGRPADTDVKDMLDRISGKPDVTDAFFRDRQELLSSTVISMTGEEVNMKIGSQASGAAARYLEFCFTPTVTPEGQMILLEMSGDLSVGEESGVAGTVHLQQCLLVYDSAPVICPVRIPGGGVPLWLSITSSLVDPAFREVEHRPLDALKMVEDED